MTSLKEAESYSVILIEDSLKSSYGVCDKDNPIHPVPLVT